MFPDDGKESNIAKGVDIATEFNEFKGTLFNKIIIRHNMRRIQGKKHKMGTYEISKISLSLFDDKRFILNDVIHTLAYFHKDLNKSILTNDHKLEGFKKILIKKRFSHMMTNKNKCVQTNPR